MKSRLPAGFGGGAPNNLSSIARQAQKMQEEMEKVTSELGEKIYEVSSGGNAVVIKITGAMEVKSIEIKPEVVDPEDTEMLSDLISAAFNEAVHQIQEEKEARLGPLTNGMSIPGLF